MQFSEVWMTALQYLSEKQGLHTSSVGLETNMLVLEDYEQAVLFSLSFMCIYSIYCTGCTPPAPSLSSLPASCTGGQPLMTAIKNSSTFIILPCLTGQFAEIVEPPAHFCACKIEGLGKGRASIVIS